MRSRGNIFIITLVVALLAGTAALIALRSPVLGLDLQGGAEVVLQAQPEKGQELTPEIMATARNILRSRIDTLGVAEPEIRQDGTDRINIALAGKRDAAQLFDIVGSTGQLYFIDQEDGLTPGVSRSVVGGGVESKETLYDVVKSLAAVKGDAADARYYAFDKTSHVAKELSGAPTKETLLRQLGLATQPSDMEILAIPEGKLVVRCTPSEQQPQCPGSADTWDPNKTKDEQSVSWYSYDLPAADKRLSGKDLDRARADFDQNGLPIVSMTFNGRGAKLFEEITKGLAEKGRKDFNEAKAANPDAELDPVQYSRRFAIILDGEFKTAPYIDFSQNPKGIQGSSSQISNLSQDEANNISLVLQSGSLPVQFVALQQNQVSATLGKASLREGLIAGLAGLVAVMIYMIIFYRFLGVIADLALLIYGALFYGVLLAIGATLTLPGIAGMILTIGVAADANVVVFERIKEEVRSGKSVRSAINAGYKKGFKTIVDANAVTLITASVLFVASQASVKGFAFLLAIGVMVSMFTAVAATRAMLGVLGNFHWFNNAAFMGASAKPVRWKMDFYGLRYRFFALSAIVILASVVSLGVRELNQGIDFTGGTRITVGLEGKTASVDEVRKLVAPIDAELKGAVIRGIGAPVSGAYAEFQIDSKQIENNSIQGVRTALQREYGNDVVPASKFSNSSVSASFGNEILRGAVLAFIFSMFLIVVYMALRFDWRYSLPMIAALLHDLIITVGVYSITGRVVTSATVAAVLTILGYSLYDTIIVFDRVRDNEIHLRRHTYGQIVNISLWETLTRSLNTSFITLLPIVSLFVFGGETLRDFAFALMVGIISGAYSSFYIACPLLAMIKEREPEFRNRPGSDELPYFLRRSDAEPVSTKAERAAGAAEGSPVAAAVGAAGDSAAASKSVVQAASTKVVSRGGDLVDESEALEAARARRAARRERKR